MRRPVEAWVTPAPSGGLPSVAFAEIAFVVWLGFAVVSGHPVMWVLSVLACLQARGPRWLNAAYWRWHLWRRRRRGRRRGVVTEHPPGVPEGASPDFDPDGPTLNV